MASGNPHVIAPYLRVQMDPDHINRAPRQPQMEFEQTHPPSRRLRLHPYSEFQACPRNELDRRTLQLANAARLLLKLDDLVAQLFDAPVVLLPLQVRICRSCSDGFRLIAWTAASEAFSRSAASLCSSWSMLKP